MKRNKSFLTTSAFLIAIVAACVGLFGGGAWSSHANKNIPGKVKLAQNARGLEAGPPSHTAKRSARKQDVPLITLQSSERMFDQEHLRALAASSSKTDKKLYALRVETGSVTICDRENKRSDDIVSARTPEAVAIGPHGHVYLADTPLNQVRILSPTGQPVGALSARRPESLAVLSTGNIVVASSVGRKLLHLYSAMETGELLKSFGEIEGFDVNDVQQNRFLNNGKVVVGPSDSIYYVSRYAPIPTVKKFSNEGQLLSEFNVEGDAIDYQIEVANRFLREKEANLVGGFHTITSATVDPATGHFWLSMNGTSRSGVVYEYEANGDKLHEYAFLLKSSNSSGIITGVQDIIVRAPWIYILTWEDHVYRFNLNNRAPGISAAPQKSRTGPQLAYVSHKVPFTPMFSEPATALVAMLQLPCPTEQPFNCSATCRTNSQPSTVDCAAEIKKRMAQGDIIYSSSCSNNAGPEPSCTGSANTCNTSTGVRATISLTLTCNPPSAVAEGRQYNNCDNAIDDDLDGYTDYDDTDCLTSPIVIDVDGNGFHLTGLSDPVVFDFDGNGRPLTLGWTARGEDDCFSRARPQR